MSRSAIPPEGSNGYKKGAKVVPDPLTTRTQTYVPAGVGGGWVLLSDLLQMH